MNIPSRTGATAGVATGAPPAPRGLGRRRTAVLAGAAITGLASTMLIPGSAAAALPTFPDNIVVFPNRDMVVLEGSFAGDAAGVPITIQVKRNGVLMGATTGVTVLGGEFEVNHPGGACWGDNSAVPGSPALPQVTPDILAGDVIEVRNAAGQLLGDTTVQDGFVTGVSRTGAVLTVNGSLGDRPTAVLDNTEQRIVNPELRDTAVARRDIRAVPGGVADGPRGGYSSNLVFNGDGTFTATYDFSLSGDQAVANATTAETGGGERFMAWEQTDAAGNRQGLTIAEKGEVGGPGMGGCPAGPGSATPTAGQYGAQWNAAGTDVVVSWTPATAQPGAAAVTGYSVEVVGKNADPAADRPVTGKRTAPAATRTTLSGLTGGAGAYDLEVRPLTADGGVGPAFARASQEPTAPTGPVDAPNETAPTATPAPAIDGSTVRTNSVSLAPAGNVEIYYTTGGVDPVDGDALHADARLYTGPIPISGPTELRWVGYNASGSVSPVGGGSYDVPVVAATAPAAPGVLRATPANGSVALTWQAGADNGSPIVDYTVTTRNGTTVVGTPQTVTGTSATVGSLTNGTSYTFQVTARNAVGSSAATSVTSIPGDGLTATLARNKARDIRIAGSSTQVGATVTVTLVQGTRRTPLGTATTVAAVAPATGATWEVRNRTAAVLPAGSTIEVVSSGGGRVTIRV